MTVLVAVRKNGKICLAADTLIDINGNLVGPNINRRSDKVFKFKDTYFAYTGSSQSSIMLQHALEEHGHELTFDGWSNIYKSLLQIHKVLKTHYFAKTETSNANQPVESSHLNFLLANSSGVYQILGDRFVGDIGTYWAAGSGAKHALGAMHACYNMFDSAAEIAAKGIEAACEFDHYCALPMTMYECELTDKAGEPVSAGDAADNGEKAD